MRFELTDKACIIAEAGTCHAHKKEGLRLFGAMKYIDGAKEAGADAIKFQMFDYPAPDTMFCWIDGDSDRSPRWKDSSMAYGEWEYAKEYAEDMGLVFLVSAFEKTTVEWTRELGLVASKVASRAARDFPYDSAPAPYLVSNGMYPIPDIDNVIGLECEANYPSTAMWTGKHPGFSDHSGNPERAIEAIRRGCKLIELHFYVDPEDAGPDLPASISIDQFKTVCKARDKVF